MEKEAQESQASQRIPLNIFHLKQQTTHTATLFYQDFWAGSWTESKEVLMDNQYWDHIKKQLLLPLIAESISVTKIHKFGLSSKHFD